MDNVVRKKASILICIVFVVETLCGCSIADRFNDFVSQEQEIKTIAQQVMQCIVNENKTELLHLFSTDIQNNYAQQITFELDRAFEFINGKIISYDYAGIYGESEKVHYGKVKFYDCNPKICNVITDSGVKYEIKFVYTRTWETKPEREGISEIRIIDAENHNSYVEIGFFYEYDE